MSRRERSKSEAPTRAARITALQSLLAGTAAKGRDSTQRREYAERVLEYVVEVRTKPQKGRLRDLIRVKRLLDWLEAEAFVLPRTRTGP